MNKKGTYQVEELIEDPGFVDFVLGRASKEELRRWEDYLTEHPAQEETVADARLFIQQLGGQDAIVDVADLDEVRHNLKSMVQADRQKPRSMRRMLMFAAAACIAFLFVSVFLFNNNETAISAAAGEQKSHMLADGSVVNLNAASNLCFDASSYNKEKRQLHLKGQAFFEVEKGKPFIVNTRLGQVEVLGTSFDVYDRSGLFIVGCKTGKVRVSHRADEVILLPGEEVRLMHNKMIKSTKNVDEIGSWKQGQFYYENVELRRILNEVERQFNTPIVCQPADLGDQLYTGYFSSSQLDSALTSVCWPLRLAIEHKNKTVIVSKN